MQGFKTIVVALLMVVATLFINNAADAAEVLKKTTDVISSPSVSGNKVSFTVSGNVKLIRHAKSLNSTFNPTDATGGTKAASGKRITRFEYNCPGYYTTRVYSDVSGTKLLGYIQVYVSTSDINNSNCDAITVPPTQTPPAPPAPQATHPDPLKNETLTPAPQPPQKYETILEMNEPEIIEIPPTIEEPEPMTWEQYCSKMDNPNPGFGRHVPMPVAGQGEVYAKCCPVGGDAAYTIFNKSNLSYSQIFEYLSEGDWICGKIMDDTDITDTYCPKTQIYDNTTNQCKISSDVNRLAYAAPEYSSDGISAMDAHVVASNPTEEPGEEPVTGAQACVKNAYSYECQNYCKNTIDNTLCLQYYNDANCEVGFFVDSVWCTQNENGGNSNTEDDYTLKILACKFNENYYAILGHSSGAPVPSLSQSKSAAYVIIEGHDVIVDKYDESELYMQSYDNYLVPVSASGYKIQLMTNSTNNNTHFSNILTDADVKNASECGTDSNTGPGEPGNPGEQPPVDCKANPMHEECVPDCYCPTLDAYAPGLGFMCCVWDCPGLDEIIQDGKNFLMDDLVGTATPPPVPQFDAGEIPNIFDVLNDVDKNIPEPITTTEDPGLSDATFDANDIKMNAEEMPVREDPTGGFDIKNPLDTLPEDGSTAPRPNNMNEEIKYPQQSTGGGNINGNISYPKSNSGSVTPPSSSGSATPPGYSDEVQYPGVGG